ncbi:MAG: LysE family transporter [Bacteroidales bacterium]|nr:LysE family transporter [Bacteroidales bacterium]
MFKYILIGAGLAFTAAVQPGPLQAYLFSRVTADGWRRTLPAAFSPLLSDGPIALLALLVLGTLAPFWQVALRIAGGILLGVLAWKAFTQWRRVKGSASLPQGRLPGSLLEAAFVNLLNPNPYLGWALVLGPVTVTAWREAPGSGIALIAAFYITMILTLAALILLFGSARLLHPGVQRRLQLISAVILAGIGVFQLITGTVALFSGPDQ